MCGSRPLRTLSSLCTQSSQPNINDAKIFTIDFSASHVVASLVMLNMELVSNIRRLKHQKFSKTSICSAISLFALAYNGAKQGPQGPIDLILAALLLVSDTRAALDKTPLELHVIQLLMPNRPPSRYQHTYSTCMGVTIVLLEARAISFQLAGDGHALAFAAMVTSVIDSYLQKHSESNDTAHLLVSTLRSVKRLMQTQDCFATVYWSLTQSGHWREVLRLVDSSALYVPVILDDWYLKLPGAPKLPPLELEEFQRLRF